MNRNWSILSLIVVLATIVSSVASAAVAQPASEEARRAQVDAATAGAVDQLRTEIGAARITPRLTVDEFLRQTNSTEPFEQVLRRAEQIGGPRWIDERVCQVQLEISGQRIADALVEIAAANPDRSPIRAEQLSGELKGWRDRSFNATGRSASGQRLELLVPVRVSEWEQISEDVRTRAIRAAQQDAARRAIESVRPVELSPGVTVGEALSNPDVSQRMNAWFESRPIRNVSFKEDLQVDLTLGAPAEETFDELIGAIRTSGAADVALPDDPQALGAARAEFVRRMVEPTGRASVARPAVEVRPQTVQVPAQAPEWVNRQIDAEGTAHVPRAQSRLACVRAAQDKAVQNLRAKIGTLSLHEAEGLTLDDAARKDPKIAQALDRAMVRARVFKVDYGADGSATVRMMIDPRDVWEELSAAR